MRRPRSLCLLAPLALATAAPAAVPGHFIEIDSYDLRVALHPAEDLLEVQASLEIANRTFYPLEAMDLYFHQAAQISAARINGAPASFEITGSRQEGAKWLTFRLDPPVPVDATVHVGVDYTLAIYERGLAGQIEPGATTVLTETHWVPYLHDFRSEHGADIAPAHLVITVPPDETAVFPGHLLREERAETGVTTEWRSDLAIQPVVISGRYRTVEEERRGQRAVGYLFADMEASQEVAMRALLRRGLEICEHFADLYGPLPEAPLRIAAADRPGGYGLPRCLLLNRGTFDFEGEIATDTFEFLAHEIAHSWYPGLMHPRARGWGIMTEGLATYSAALAVEHFLGADAAREVWRRNQQRVASEKEPRPLIEGGTGALIYHRGAHWWRTLERLLGRERLHGLLRTFTQEHAMSAVAFDDFFAWLNEQTPERDLVPVFDWMLRTNDLANVAVDGAPVITPNPAGGVSAEITLVATGLEGLPFDVEVQGEGGVVVRREAVIGPERRQRLTLALPGPVSAVVLDPDAWLLQSQCQDDRWPRERGAEAFYRRAAAAWREGDFQAGLEPIAQALARQPENPQYHLMAGLLLEGVDDLGGAMEHLTRALDLLGESSDITRAWLLVALGRVSLKLDRIDDARAHWFQVQRTEKTARAHAEAQAGLRALDEALSAAPASP